jgi:hypothetical protein
MSQLPIQLCQPPRAMLTMFQHPLPHQGAGALRPCSPPQGQDVDPLLDLQQPLRVSGQCHGIAGGSQGWRVRVIWGLLSVVAPGIVA